MRFVTHHHGHYFYSFHHLSQFPQTTASLMANIHSRTSNACNLKMSLQRIQSTLKRTYFYLPFNRIRRGGG